MSKTAEVAVRPGLARVSEAAKFLSVSPGLLYKMIASGEGSVPVKRIGDAIRIPWRWLEEQAAIDEEGQD